MPSDFLLSQLAGKIGMEWEQVGALLGLSDSEMYRCKVESQYNLWGQVNKALHIWRNREYTNATIGKLVWALQESGVGREKFEFLMNA